MVLNGISLHHVAFDEDVFILDDFALQTAGLSFLLERSLLLLDCVVFLHILEGLLHLLFHYLRGLVQLFLFFDFLFLNFRKLLFSGDLVVEDLKTARVVLAIRV
jgi:hypothetical protein